MAGLVEAAVERAREEQEKNDDQQPGSTGKRPANDGVKSTGEAGVRPTKKARFSPNLPSGPSVVEWQNLPPVQAKDKGKGKKRTTHIHMYPDAVTEGIVSEEEGREMMSMRVTLPLAYRRS
jgi:hypothetical protein